MEWILTCDKPLCEKCVIHLNEYMDICLGCFQAIKKQLGSVARSSRSKVATAGQPPSLLGQLPCLAHGHPDLPARRLGSRSGRSVDLPSFLRELTELSARVLVLPWSTIPSDLSLLRRETEAGIVLSCIGLARRFRSVGLSPLGGSPHAKACQARYRNKNTNPTMRRWWG